MEKYDYQVFITGRRMNSNISKQLSIPYGIKKQDQYIESLGKNSVLFQTDAEDYFIFSKNAIPWRDIKDIVIGRPGYDNYLVDYVYHHQNDISLIDTTNSSKVNLRINE